MDKGEGMMYRYLNYSDTFEAMTNGLSCNVSLHEEELEGKKVFIAECTELGISDFGEDINEAMKNLKEGIKLLLIEAPEKRELLEKEEPLMVTRLFL